MGCPLLFPNPPLGLLPLLIFFFHTIPHQGSWSQVEYVQMQNLWYGFVKIHVTEKLCVIVFQEHEFQQILNTDLASGHTLTTAFGFIRERQVV